MNEPGRQRRRFLRQLGGTASLAALSLALPTAQAQTSTWPSKPLRVVIAIACACACQPRLILCDEPTTALDVTVQKEVLRIAGLARAGHGVLLDAIPLPDPDLSWLGRHPPGRAEPWAASGPDPPPIG